MPKNYEIGTQPKHSRLASTLDRAKSVSFLRRLFSKPKNYPGISGVDITNGLRYITAVEDTVEKGIRDVSKRERRNILSVYKTAFHLAKRGVVDLMHKMEEEGEL
ncbi:MAG: hypothetical protein J5382_10315 [Bacteroidales bacterium]|nr:hypothetical protein [Bacteroidales bacterium]